MNILKQGDTIGIICPSYVADKNDYEKYKSGIEKLGFKVKLGKNIYKDTNRYTASVEERVNDLNEMVYDKNVKMILFDGGCGSVDLMPKQVQPHIMVRHRSYLIISVSTTGNNLFRIL